MMVGALGAQEAQGYSGGTSNDSSLYLWPIPFGAALPRLARNFAQVSCYIQEVEIEVRAEPPAPIPA